MGVPALLAAASTSLGLNKLSAWLTAHEYHWLTPRRLKIVTPIAVWTVLIAVFSVRF